MPSVIRKLGCFLFLLCAASAHAAQAHRHRTGHVNLENYHRFFTMQWMVETKGAGHMKQSVGYTKHTCGIKREACKPKDEQKKTVGKKGKMDLCLKLFIAGLAVLITSLVVTIFEFSFLMFASLLAVIGWVIFGIGMVLVVLALVVAVIQWLVICRIGKGITWYFLL